MPRKPTPRNLKLLAGTLRPHRDTPEPSFDLVANFPEPPHTLNLDGADLWHQLGRQLVASRVLTVADLSALEMLCYNWQRFRAKATHGLEQTPAEQTALRLLFSEFGMTPAARRRVAATAEASEGNRFAKYAKDTPT